MQPLPPYVAAREIYAGWNLTHFQGRNAKERGPAEALPRRQKVASRIWAGRILAPVGNGSSQAPLMSPGGAWPCWAGRQAVAAVDVLVDSHPQHLTVELCESARIGAVDHCFFEASDHIESMSACWWQPLPLTGKIASILVPHDHLHNNQMRTLAGAELLRFRLFAGRAGGRFSEVADDVVGTLAARIQVRVVDAHRPARAPVRSQGRGGDLA